MSDSSDASAAERRSCEGFARPWLRCLSRASLAAFLVALIELVFLVVPIPYATSSVSGLLAFMWSAYVLVFLALVPVTAFLALWERHGPKVLLPPPAPMLAVGFTLLAVALLSRPLLLFRHGERNEFPRILVELPNTMLVLLLAGGSVLCWLVAFPLARKLVERFPEAIISSRLLSVLFGDLAVQAHWVAYIGLEPLNQGLWAGVAALCAAILWMLALPALPWSSRWLLVPIAPVVAFVLLLPLGLSGLNHMHGRFLLFNNGVAPRMTISRLHDLADFDGDGTAPTWLGGTDCAPFDDERGPGILDVPGDGVDQNCSGKDRQIATQQPEQTMRCVPASGELSILLITIDAWRFDTMFSKFTESISGFARQSLFYSRAYAPGNLTVQTIAPLLSGRPSAELRAANPLARNAQVSTNALVTAAQKSGMATVALHHLSFPPGYDQGFGPRFLGPQGGLDTEAAPGGDFLGDLTSAGLTDELLRWLDRQTGKRFFAWVHYTDPHAPYLSANAGGAMAEYNNTYWGELAYTDFHVGRALRAVSERGLAKNTVIVISSDHGEELGRYGRQGHGTNVFEDTAHVPLILWVPGCKPEFIDEPVSLTQVAPTLAKLAGLTLPGLSLLSVRPAPMEGVISEAIATAFEGDESFFKRAFIYGRYKLIHDVRRGGMLFFDLEADPAETENLWYSAPARRNELLAAYQRYLDNEYATSAPR